MVNPRRPHADARPCLDPPAWLPDARQYFTRFAVDGTAAEASTVEAMRDRGIDPRRRKEVLARLG
jgi:hypothetical protein